MAVLEYVELEVWKPLAAGRFTIAYAAQKLIGLIDEDIGLITQILTHINRNDTRIRIPLVSLREVLELIGFNTLKNVQ